MYQSAPKPDNESQRVEDLHDAYLLFTVEEERFDNIVRLASRMFDVPTAMVSLVDDDIQWFKARCGTELKSTPRDISFCTHVVFKGDHVIVPNTLEDPRFAENPLVVGPPYIRFYAGVPIRLRSGSVLGTLCIVDYKPRTFSPEQSNLLQILADQATDLIELRQEVINRRLVNQAAKQSTHFIVLFNEQGKPVLVNPALRRALNFSETDFVHIQEIFSPPHLATIQEHIQYAYTHDTVWSGELELHASNARGLPIHATIFGLESPMHVPKHVAAVMYDLTQQKHISAMKDAFVSLVSHELRTPITSVYGSLRLLENETVGKLPPNALHVAQIASRNCRRLIRLINDILDLQTIKSGTLPLCLSDVRVETLFSEALDIVGPLALEYSVSIQTHNDIDASFRADQDRIVQVLVNILSNALKHSPSGESIRVEATESDGMLRVSVHDHGPGIAEHDLKNLFVPFQQLPNTPKRSLQGTGLGLVISQAIVHQHGGKIGVTSHPGSGATFWFTLPMHTDDLSRETL